ncbi:MAG TPA: ELWxxDGT repeat protein [Thermoanaerobaculia bacterium]|nr:ELWxxDGT repeat protein [Thermoanaerobaculia bacterium]
MNGKLIFNANDGRNGTELWTTDGTAAGTRLLADIRTGFASSFPGERIVYHGQMIFDADDGVDGRELWITDGTPAGTHFLNDLSPGAGNSNPGGYVLFHDLIYFGAGTGLWKSDGTGGGRRKCLQPRRRRLADVFRGRKHRNGQRIVGE